MMYVVGLAESQKCMQMQWELRSEWETNIGMDSGGGGGSVAMVNGSQSTLT